jgi:GT2 family glycosyltransferase/glycosyltransferase involved in cell wall biosynthesis
MSRCDVVIPVKNGSWWLERCLHHLFLSTKQADLGKVLVLDDDSSPLQASRIADLCKLHEGVELIRSEVPLGFGGACNLAMRSTSANYVCLLNSDCLLTPSALRKLIRACKDDPRIGLACPPSNNSPLLTLPLSPGLSFIEMNELCEKAACGLPPEEIAIDVCTVVGHCLVVTKECWQRVGEFSSEWSSGYGEESDYHMRAAELGFRGVAVTDTYVFHFGGGTFRRLKAVEQLKRRNHKAFMEKWGAAYQELKSRSDKREPIATITARLETIPKRAQEADVLFILPGLNAGVGGLQVVIDLCNALTLRGISAHCLILSPEPMDPNESYPDSIYCGLWWARDGCEALMMDGPRPRLVVATLFTTVPLARALADAHGVPWINFVQGYEALFEDGRYYGEVVDAFALSARLVVTSDWLGERSRQHAPHAALRHAPLGVEPELFHPDPSLRTIEAGLRVRVAIFIRTARDKGQGVLLDVVRHLLERDEIEITLFFPSTYTLPGAWSSHERLRQVEAPLPRESIADELRRCQILIDASPFEGFGLLPLEAMACGATVVAADSGGVRQYIDDGGNGVIVERVNQPEVYVDIVMELVHDPSRLADLRRAAAEEGLRWHPSRMIDAWAAIVREPHDPSEYRSKVTFPPIVGDTTRRHIEDHDLIAWLRPEMQARLLGAFERSSGPTLRIDLADVASANPAAEWSRRSKALRVRAHDVVRLDLGIGFDRPVDSVAWLDVTGPGVVVELRGEGPGTEVLLRPGPNRLVVSLPRLAGVVRMKLPPCSGGFMLRRLEIRSIEALREPSDRRPRAHPDEGPGTGAERFAYYQENEHLLRVAVGESRSSGALPGYQKTRWYPAFLRIKHWIPVPLRELGRTVLLARDR